MSIELLLERKILTSASSMGSLYINYGEGNTFLCYTLEDCVREVPSVPVSSWKVPHETAIPVGRYKILKTFSNRFQRVTLQLIDVSGFDGIRIHAGNYAKDTDGCILCGMTIGLNMIGQSQEALAKVEEIIFALLDKGEEVWVTIQ